MGVKEKNCVLLWKQYMPIMYVYTCVLRLAVAHSIKVFKELNEKSESRFEV